MKTRQVRRAEHIRKGMKQSQSGVSIPAEAGKVENSAGGENATLSSLFSSSRRKIWNSSKGQKGAEVSEWACE